MKRSQDIRIQMLMGPHTSEAGLLCCESPTRARGNVASFPDQVTDGSATQLLPPSGPETQTSIVELS